MNRDKLLKNILLLTILLITFSGTSCVEVPITGEVKVIKVTDGDTIVIEGGHRVRYIGIDAPEKGEAYYFEALEANRRLVEGKKVRLEKDVSDKDKHGRLLRYVYVNDTLVNAELVRQGYARARSYPPDTKYQVYLEMAEREAKLKGRGIWRQK